MPADLETLVMERSKWRSLCKTSIQQFESDRIRALEAKREQRKTATIRSAACYPCQICCQTCASRIGLYSHSRSHASTLTTIRDQSCRRPSPTTSYGKRFYVVLKRFIYFFHVCNVLTFYFFFSDVFHMYDLSKLDALVAGVSKLKPITIFTVD